MTIVEPIAIPGDPNHRIVVEYDEGTECPRGDWHMLTGFVKLRGYGNSRHSDVPAVHTPPIDIADAHSRMDYGLFTNGHVDVQESLVRWAKIFHGLHLEYDSAHGGFWFVAGADAATAATPVDAYSRCSFYDNWPEIEQGSAESLAKQAEVIKQEQEVYRQWADGEVYIVALEEKVAWGKLSDDGSTLLQGEGTVREEWEETESLGGCYLDDTYTALVVADNHFPVEIPKEGVPA